jgi:hypothetical protein
MSEDREQDAVHGCFVLEGAHGPGPSSDFAKASFNGVGGSDFAALVLRFIAEAGEQLVEIVAPEIANAPDSTHVAELIPAAAPASAPPTRKPAKQKSPTQPFTFIAQ